MNETPDGLHRMQYAVHLLEEVLGWPSKGNAELMADCLLAISRSRRISIKQAHTYMERAIRLAREQCIEIDRHWFMGGEYTKVRPSHQALDKHEPISEQDWRAAQDDRNGYFSSPEYKASLRRIQEKMSRAFNGKVTP